MQLAARWTSRTAARLGAEAVFRPTVGTSCWVLWLIAAVGWPAMTVGEDPIGAVRHLPLIAVLTIAVYATCRRPLVAVREDGVLVRNVLREVDIPWSLLADVGTRYALTLTTSDGRRISAWAAPAASRFSTARVTRSDVRAVAWNDAPDADGSLSIPASATHRSDSGAAAAMIRRARRRYADRPPALDPSHGGAADRVVVRWATPLIGLLAITGALALVLPRLG